MLSRLSLGFAILLATLAAAAVRAGDSSNVRVASVKPGLCIAPVADTAAKPSGTGSSRPLDIRSLRQFPFYPYVLGTNGQLWTIGDDNARQVLVETWYDHAPDQIMADTVAAKLLVTTEKGLFTIEPGPRLVAVDGQPAGLKRVRAAVYTERTGVAFLLTDEVLYRYRAGDGFKELEATRGALLEPVTQPPGIESVPPSRPRVGGVSYLQSPRMFDLPYSRRLMAVDRNRVMLVDDVGAVQVIVSPALDPHEHIGEVLDMADGSGALIITRRDILALVQEAGTFTLRSLIGGSSISASYLGVEGLRDAESPGSYRGLKGATRLPNALILYDDGRSFGDTKGTRNTAFNITPRRGIEPFPGQERYGKIYEIFPSKELGRLLISAQRGVFREGDDGSFELVPDSSLEVTGGIRNFQDVPRQGVVIANPFNVIATAKDVLDPTLRLIQCTRELCPNIISDDPGRAWFTGKAAPFEVRREGGLVSLADGSVFGSWPEFMPGWNPDETLVLGSYFGRYVKGGAPKAYTNPSIAGRRAVEAATTLSHPSAAALLTVRDKQLYALSPNANDMLIEGASRLAGVPVGFVAPLDHDKSALVEAGGKLFKVFDTSTPQARACSKPIEVEETSASLCAVRLRIAQNNGAYTNLDERLRSFITAPDGRSMWFVTDHGALVSLAPGPAGAQKIGGIDVRSTPFSVRLFTLPWLDGAVMQTRDDLWNFLASGEGRRIGPNVQEDPARSEQPSRWILPERRTVVMRGKPTADRAQAQSTSNLWALTANGAPELIPLPGPAELVAALPEADTLLAVTTAKVEVQLPGLDCERLGCGHDIVETKLWRLNTANVAEEVALPPERSAPARPPRDELSPEAQIRARPGQISALFAWPSHRRILVVTDRRLLSYGDGELKELFGRYDGRFDVYWHYEVLVDRGVGRDALAIGNGLAFVSDTGHVSELEVPPGSYSSAAVIPGTTHVIVAGSAGALIIGDDGAVTPLLDPSSPSGAPVTEVHALPWWNAVLIRTQNGWRVLESDGRLRRIGGTQFQLDSRGAASIVADANRVVVDGYPLHEIVAMEPGGPSCDSRGFDFELPPIAR